MQRYDFELQQGETHSEVLQFEDSNGVVLPLAGLSGRMQIRVKNADGLVADELTTANGRITINTITNKLTLNWTATQTAALPVDFYVYDLELYNNTSVFKPIYGIITIPMREVTR